eukprot:2938006-Rhodomonas_salina.1
MPEQSHHPHTHSRCPEHAADSAECGRREIKSKAADSRYKVYGGCEGMRLIRTCMACGSREPSSSVFNA